MVSHTPSDAGNPSSAVTEEALHAFTDGRLDAAAQEALAQRIAQDPQAQATLQAWQRQRRALQGLHAGLLHEPVPAAMAAAAQAADTRRMQGRRWWGRGAMAASVLAAFGLGWWSHGWQGSGAASLQASATAARASAASEFARQASVAHLVYAPEQRHPVEVGAAQQEHLVQWLSKRLARPLKVPDLHAQGFELVGGRLLPGAEGARAQFMFQDAAGLRITLYLGAVQPPPGQPAATLARETAFSFASDGPVPGFYWVDQGFGYALAGPLPRDRLLALAQRVYEQLQGLPQPLPQPLQQPFQQPASPPASRPSGPSS